MASSAIESQRRTAAQPFCGVAIGAPTDLDLAIEVCGQGQIPLPEVDGGKTVAGFTERLLDRPAVDEWRLSLGARYGSR